MRASCGSLLSVRYRSLNCHGRPQINAPADVSSVSETIRRQKATSTVFEVSDIYDAADATQYDGFLLFEVQ
jgi:hypothetical protein